MLLREEAAGKFRTGCLTESSRDPGSTTAACVVKDLFSHEKDIPKG